MTMVKIHIGPLLHSTLPRSHCPERILFTTGCVSFQSFFYARAVIYFSVFPLKFQAHRRGVRTVQRVPAYSSPRFPLFTCHYFFLNHSRVRCTREGFLPLCVFQCVHPKSKAVLFHNCTMIKTRK